MVEAFSQVGGPPTLVRLLLASSLKEHFDLHVVTYNTPGLSYGALDRLRVQLRAIQPDLVHIHGLKADGFLAVLAARLARVPRLLVTVHGSTADSMTAYRGTRMRLRRALVSHVLEPASLRLADAVNCVCQAMGQRSLIRRHAGPRLMDTIHNGLPPLPQSRESAVSRDAFHFKANDLVFLYTGRISRDKGLEILAAAFKHVLNESREKRPLKLLLVGDGEELQLIRSLFEPLVSSGQVVFAGRRDDVQALYAMSDVFVFPSFHENLSFSLLEAMQAGLPVIATAVGGNSEVVENNQTGLLIPPGAIAPLAGAMLEMAVRPTEREAMGRRGRQRIADCFSIGMTVKKLETLYRQMLGRTYR
jgi:glycosyltransferase involved in cell wall biosynthesis